MSSHLHALSPVDIESLPEYPISASERLDSHYFIPWNLKRWRKSVFRQLAEPEIGWYGFLLFCEAHEEAPLGTLPDDERLLARTLGLSVERWRNLLKHDINPLHNWSRVRCDNGEVRLAHPVVTEVALEALKSRRQRAAWVEAARQRKRWERLRQQVVQAGAHSAMAQNEALIEWIDTWLEQHCVGNRTIEMVRKALEAHSETHQ